MISTRGFVVLRSVARAAVIAVVVGEGVAVAADDAAAIAAKGKALYRAAAYEEALAVFTAAESPEAMQYRGLCLLALDRTLEARAAVEWLVRHAPDFTPERDLPPRFISLFTETRADVLPDVLQTRLTAARQQFDIRSYADARHGFETVAALAADAAVAGDEGFADIASEAADYVKRIDAAVAVKVESPTAAAAPAAAPASAIVRQRTIIAPVVLRQTLPPWPATEAAPKGASGAVRVVIGIDGHVRRASIERLINPRFDLALLAAARSWTYMPATMNGQPIEVEKVVEVRLP